MTTSVVDPVRSAWQRAQDAGRWTAATYAARAEDDRPLGGYVKTMAVYSTLTATAALVSRIRGVRLPRAVPPADVALLGIATYQVSRLIGKESVTSPLRARFTRYVKPAGPAEVQEEPRGTGSTHAMGELLTCPFCLAQWVATGMIFAYLWHPRLTRWTAATMTVVAASNLMQFVHARVSPE